VPAATFTDAQATPADEPTPSAEMIPLPAMPPVDPVLLEILRSEVAQYLQTIRAAIAQGTDGLEVKEALLHAVHTLHGAIAMVDLDLLTRLLSPVESLLKRLRAAGEPLSAEGVRLLSEATDAVDQVMAQFEVAEPHLPDLDPLVARFTELRDARPEPQSPHGTLEMPEATAHASFFGEGPDSAISPAETPAATTPIEVIENNDDTATATASGLDGLDAFEPAQAALSTDSAAAPAETTDAGSAASNDVTAMDEPAAEEPVTESVPAPVEPSLATPIESAPMETDAIETAPVETPAIEVPMPPSIAVEAPPGEPWSGQVDPDLLEVFVEEANELLDHADGLLAQWRAEPAELARVVDLQRDLHTLKGGARIAGLMPVGDLAHAIETLLEKPIVGGHASVMGVIRALESGFDRLHTLVRRVSHAQAINYPQDLIDRFLGMAGEEKLVERDEVPSAMPVVVPAAALPELLPEEQPDDEMRALPQQEQIRVRAELLDSLVNHAGEVAIYRSRLEQQVSAYRFNLVELEQTVTRLRSQLRMLEIETEAQIIARYQREHREAGMATFDPLELDRFSQLQQYSRALAESVSDLVSIQNTFDDLTRQAETLLIQQSRVSADLQEGLLRTRMLPFDTMVPNLRRTLRQAAQEEGKHAQLVVEGAHGEMDRNLLDRLKAPFEHMLRNAIAHGIESPAERRKAGKPDDGTVRISVAREATEVVVRIGDDGRGLDREAVRRRAVERGLIGADTRLSDDEVLALIARPGFSTASTVTQLAGRGVGMDVVANEIKQLGGSLSVESQPGRGTTFVLRMPFTLAVTQAILVRTGEASFAIPMTSVQGVARISPIELAARMTEDAPAFEYNGESYGIHDLSDLLGLPPGHTVEDEQVPLLLTRAGDLRAAIRIDTVIGSREIVVKSVGPQISSVPGVLGATIMGDGSVLVILDLAPLVRRGMLRREQLEIDDAASTPTIATEESGRPLVMVVDDSITMRKVTSRVLERQEYEVTTAKDGLDALEKLHEARVPDLMLLDIEMPRMDGYELATQMKSDPRLRDVPVIMITSRTGEKHRQRAFDIGVDRYLGKPYQEAELLAQIGEVLAQRAERGDG